MKNKITLILVIICGIVSIFLLGSSFNFNEIESDDFNLDEEKVEIDNSNDSNEEVANDAESSIENVVQNKTMYCTSQQTIEATRFQGQIDGTYTHILYFENDKCTKYEMKSVEKYYNWNDYYSRKQSLDTKDDTYDDATMTITSIIGDGHNGSNGNEDFYRYKTIEEIKQMMTQEICEVTNND